MRRAMLPLRFARESVRRSSAAADWLKLLSGRPLRICRDDHLRGELLRSCRVCRFGRALLWLPFLPIAGDGA